MCFSYWNRMLGWWHNTGRDCLVKTACFDSERHKKWLSNFVHNVELSQTGYAKIQPYIKQTGLLERASAKLFHCFSQWFWMFMFHSCFSSTSSTIWNTYILGRKYIYNIYIHIILGGSKKKEVRFWKYSVKYSISITFFFFFFFFFYSICNRFALKNV